MIPLLAFFVVFVAVGSMRRKGQLTSRTQAVLLVITGLLCLTAVVLQLLHRSTPR